MHTIMKHAFLPLHSIGGSGNGPGRFDQPSAIAFDGAGRLVVGDALNGRLQLFAPGGELLHAWSLPDFTPSAAAVTPDGSIWACDLHGGRVLRFTPGGDHVGSIGGLDPFLAPSGIAALPDGRVVVADTGNHRLRVFSPEGEPHASFDGGTSGPMREPHGLACDRHGTVVAVDRHRRRLIRFGPEWDYPEEIGLHLAPGSPVLPWDVAIDRSGRMAVSMTGSNRVLLLSPGGDLLDTMSGEGSALGRLVWPTALAYGPGDLLAIADTYHDRVVLAKAA